MKVIIEYIIVGIVIFTGISVAISLLIVIASSGTYFLIPKIRNNNNIKLARKIVEVCDEKSISKLLNE